MSTCLKCNEVAWYFVVINYIRYIYIYYYRWNSPGYEDQSMNDFL